MMNWTTMSILSICRNLSFNPLTTVTQFTIPALLSADYLQSNTLTVSYGLFMNNCNFSIDDTL